MKGCYCIFMVILLFTAGCYTTSDYNVPSGYRQLAVDGMVVFYEDDSLGHKQDTVTLTYSKNYTSTEDILTVDDALLTIVDKSGFTDTLKAIGKGKYTTQKLIAQKSNSYTLNISLSNGEQYAASTVIPHKGAKFTGLPQRDTCRIIATLLGSIPKGVFVDLDASDRAGAGDGYWFKTFVKRKFDPMSLYNNAYTTNVQQGNPYSPWKTFRSFENIQISVDYSGSGDVSTLLPNETDALFSLPLRLGVTMYNEDQSDYPAYFPGDSLKVLIYAITLDQVNYLYAIQNQLSNGTGGGLNALFATPPYNVTTNIVNKDKNGKKALGWFGGAVLTGKRIRIKDFKFIKDQDKNAASYVCP